MFETRYRLDASVAAAVAAVTAAVTDTLLSFSPSFVRNDNDEVIYVRIRAYTYWGTQLNAGRNAFALSRDAAGRLPRARERERRTRVITRAGMAAE